MCVCACVSVRVCVYLCTCVLSLKLHTRGALRVNHRALVCRIQSSNKQLVVVHVGRHLIYWGTGEAVPRKLKQLKKLSKDEQVATHARVIPGTTVSMAIRPHLSSRVES